MQDIDQDYKRILADLIQKQIVVLGPDITMAVVRRVGGVQVDQSGLVTKVEGEGQEIFQKLIAEFSHLSEHNANQATLDIQRDIL